MNKKNTTKKSIKPKYVVDITKCEDATDVLIAFGKTKQKAGLPITDDELDAIIENDGTTIILMNEFIGECKCECKKPNVFKRIWRKLFGKKN